MKIIYMLVFSLTLIKAASAISPGEHYETTVTLSPSRFHLITNDWCCYDESGAYTTERPYTERSTLYSLPLSTSPGKALQPGEYSWSEHGKYFMAVEWARDMYRGDMWASPYIIWGYNTSGEKIDVPGYGTAPTFSFKEDTIIYSSEFSDTGEIIAPRLFEFNFQKKTRTLLASFPDMFSFYPMPVEDIMGDNVAPDPTPITQTWGGHRGLIYKRNPEQGEEPAYTFVVPWNTDPKSEASKGVKLIIWKGNHISSMYPPPQPPFLEEK